MGGITEAAGLVHGVCPKRGFEEINLCLIHEYHIKSFCSSVFVTVMLSNANPKTLGTRKFSSFLFIYQFITWVWSIKKLTEVAVILFILARFTLLK